VKDRPSWAAVPAKNRSKILDPGDDLGRANGKPNADQGGDIGIRRPMPDDIARHYREEDQGLQQEPHRKPPHLGGGKGWLLHLARRREGEIRRRFEPRQGISRKFEDPLNNCASPFGGSVRLPSVTDRSRGERGHHLSPIASVKATGADDYLEPMTSSHKKEMANPAK
jgi:hypothetical protein